MKKLLAAVLLVAMILMCFASCGENPKKQETIDAFNKTSTAFDEVATLINANADSIDDEIISVYKDLSALLTEYKELLESDTELTDEKYDEIIAWLGTAHTAVSDAKTEIETALAALTAEVETEEAVVTEEVVESVFPEALANVPAYEVSDIALTGWQLAGGMINGVEMEQADLDAVLAACGGTFQFIFLSDGQAMMVNGEVAYEGTYEAIYENAALYLAFDGYEYYAVLTEVNGALVLIAANTADSTTALYFSLIEEG